MENIKSTWNLENLEEEYKDLSIWDIKYSVYENGVENKKSLVGEEEIDMDGVQLFLDEITYNDQQITSSLEEENKLKDDYNKYAKEFNKYNHELKKYVEGTVSEEAIEKSLESKRSELNKINSKKDRLGGKISKIEQTKKEELENEINILENRKNEFLNFKATALENYNKSKEQYGEVQSQRLNYEKELKKYEGYILKTFEYSFNKMALANVKLEEATDAFVEEEDLKEKSYRGDEYRESLEHYELLHDMYNNFHRVVCDSETIKNVPDLLDILSKKQEQLEEDFVNKNINEIDPRPERVEKVETINDIKSEDLDVDKILESFEDEVVDNKDFIDTKEETKAEEVPTLEPQEEDFIDSYVTSEIPTIDELTKVEPKTLEDLALEESKTEVPVVETPVEQTEEVKEDNNDFIDTNDDIKPNVVNDSVDFIQDDSFAPVDDNYMGQTYDNYTNSYDEEQSFVDTPRALVK